MTDLDKLKHLVLAPYILKATALIGVSRRVGAINSGTDFQHWVFCWIINTQR